MKDAALIDSSKVARREGILSRSEQKQRFTIDGDDELEAYLKRLCSQARFAVEKVIPASILEAILLGGGYGRGEGGVLRTASGDQPYNDLEFYVFLRGFPVLTERKFQPGLDEVAHELSKKAELEIELRATSFPKLRKTPPTMFHYDLVMGHRWIMGEESLLRGCEQHREAERIPMSGATRLLLNRCSGLLFARQRLLRETFGPDDADFVARNIAKAKLALGDAFLTVRGEYHWSCRRRNDSLHGAESDLPWMPDVRKAHSEGVDFKLHPERSLASRDELAESHIAICDLARQVWLWLETRRLQTEFRSTEDYALSPIDKCPEKVAWKNACINFRTFGRVAMSRKVLRYPRERLLNTLPLLLWRSDAQTFSDPGLLRFVQRELRTNAPCFESLVESYRKLWHCFN